LGWYGGGNGCDGREREGSFSFRAKTEIIVVVVRKERGALYPHWTKGNLKKKE
jgi:hypothetical protein